MKVLKSVLWTLGVFSIIIYFVINHSSVESRYKCYGRISSRTEDQEQKAYLRIVHYRPWVHLWSKSDGIIWFEIPNHKYEVFSLVQINPGVHVFMKNSDASVHGHFSYMSKSLVINNPNWSYVGECIELPK